MRPPGVPFAQLLALLASVRPTETIETREVCSPCRHGRHAAWYARATRWLLGPWKPQNPHPKY